MRSPLNVVARHFLYGNRINEFHHWADIDVSMQYHFIITRENNIFTPSSQSIMKLRDYVSLETYDFCRKNFSYKYDLVKDEEINHIELASMEIYYEYLNDDIPRLQSWTTKAFKCGRYDLVKFLMEKGFPAPEE